MLACILKELGLLDMSFGETVLVASGGRLRGAHAVLAPPEPGVLRGSRARHRSGLPRRHRGQRSARRRGPWALSVSRPRGAWSPSSSPWRSKGLVELIVLNNGNERKVAVRALPILCTAGAGRHNVCHLPDHGAYDDGAGDASERGGEGGGWHAGGAAARGGGVWRARGQGHARSERSPACEQGAAHDGAMGGQRCSVLWIHAARQARHERAERAQHEQSLWASAASTCGIATAVVLVLVDPSTAG
uniref:Uncharacterized protein n=1 Tax=Saccharum spontaneum TaxID=62335 RepID=A0A678T8X9_SACSP|nr:hypothetical protein SS33C03_000001 [Saccharum spontaneum]